MYGSVVMYFVGHTREDALFGRIYDNHADAANRAALDGKKVFIADTGTLDTDDFEECG